MAAARARTKAEWRRATTTRMEELYKIDRKASTIDTSLAEEKKGIIRSVQCGGNVGKQLISTFNNAYEDKCNYCRKAASTGTHIRWECEYFEPIRQATDKAIADIPRKYLSDPVKCGIAPALYIEGELTYWGMEVDSQESPETKRLLGIDDELSKGGKDGDETRRREEATNLIDDRKRGNRNARQSMLKHKQAHGAGYMPTFPTDQEITEAMEGYSEDHLVPAYGDGSQTPPSNSWAALGGFWSLDTKLGPSRTG